MRNRKSHANSGFLLGIAIIGFIGILLATPWGAGVTPDATFYLQGAQNISNGLGYVWIDFCSGASKAITHWPPFFSFILSLGAHFDLEPLAGTRWLNASLFAANIVLTGFILKNCASPMLWIFACISVLASIPMLEIHTAAWTEPLFIFLSILGLYRLGIYLEHGKRQVLITASILIGLALFTRYAGVALVATGIFAILFLSNQKIYKKISDVSIFSSLTILPFIFLIVRNQQAASSFGSREFKLNLIIFEHIDAMATSFSSWLLPASDRVVYLPAQDFITIFVFILALILWIGLVCKLLWLKPSNTNRLKIFIPFIFIYIAMLFIVATLTTNPPVFDNRLLSPLFLPILILGIRGLNQVIVSSQPQFFKTAIPFSIISLSIIYILSGSLLIHHLHKNGRGYTARDWQYLEIADKIKSLPEDAIIISNQFNFIPFAYQRCAHPLRQRHISTPSDIRAFLATLDKDRHLFMLHFDSARRFPPRKEAAQGQKDISLKQAQNVVAIRNGKLILQEHNAFLYEIPNISANAALQ